MTQADDIKKVKSKRGGKRIRTTPRCGRPTRAGGGHPCQLEAGKKTDHFGTGACFLHGGCARIIHGLYSKVVQAKRRETYQAALNAEHPNDMTEHIALLDGVILPAALERGEKEPTHDGQVDPLLIQMQAIETKSKIVKRQSDMEQSKKIAFTQAELRMLVLQVVTIVAEYVDAPTLKKISMRIGTSTLAPPGDI